MVLALELAAFLHQPMPKQQLTSLQVESVYPQVELGAEQLREYLDTPPSGMCTSKTGDVHRFIVFYKLSSRTVEEAQIPK